MNRLKKVKCFKYKINRKWFKRDRRTSTLLKINKKNLYSYVYARQYDLTKYDTSLLTKYNLKKSKYIYIGSTSREYLNTKNYDLKRQMNAHKYRNNKLVCFIKSYKSFLENETNMTKLEIEREVFKIKEICYRKNRQVTYHEEYKLNDYYKNKSMLKTQQKLIVLSESDSNYKVEEHNSLKILTIRERKLVER